MLFLLKYCVKMWSIGSRDSVGVAVLRAFAAAAYRALGSEQTAVRQPQGVSAQRHWATAGFIVVMGVKLSTVYRGTSAAVTVLFRNALSRKILLATERVLVVTSPKKRGSS